MLRSIKDLHGSTVSASDGDIGSVSQAYFDDESWGVRYLVVETGNWLNDRQVLVSPYSVKHTDPGSSSVHVGLSRQQVRDSPMLDTHKPVSRQHEIEYLRYYSYPTYWGGPNLWGMGAYPAYDPTGVPPDALPEAPAGPTLHTNKPEPDVHLRSTNEVKGYHLKTADGSIGHVSDFIYDDTNWAIRYLVVEAHNWWPGGKAVLIAAHWIDGVDWFDSTVSTALTRDIIRDSPAYDDSMPIERHYEVVLHRFYGKHGYWSDADADERIASD
ncbi:PRC-barrel domain containing protein [Paraburkholderia strydomiana]|jgi:hypothetical protein|uniref:PRC-barrel domain-containing protein n=1 Tax=Paraburkholderia strydomiana TaxID=1245417 RepID=A0ABW9CE67_9BURK